MNASVIRRRFRQNFSPEPAPESKAAAICLLMNLQAEIDCVNGGTTLIEDGEEQPPLLHEWLTERDYERLTEAVSAFHAYLDLRLRSSVISPRRSRSASLSEVSLVFISTHEKLKQVMRRETKSAEDLRCLDTASLHGLNAARLSCVVTSLFGLTIYIDEVRYAHRQSKIFQSGIYPRFT